MRALLGRDSKTKFVWGGLCNEETWYFGRVERGAGGNPASIMLRGPLNFHTSRELGVMECTVHTKPTLEYLLSLVHGETLPQEHFTADRLQTSIARFLATGLAAAEKSVASFRAVDNRGRNAVVGSLMAEYKADCEQKGIVATLDGFAAYSVLKDNNV